MATDEIAEWAKLSLRVGVIFGLTARMTAQAAIDSALVSRIPSSPYKEDSIASTASLACEKQLSSSANPHPPSEYVSRVANAARLLASIRRRSMGWQQATANSLSFRSLPMFST